MGNFINEVKKQFSSAAYWAGLFVKAVSTAAILLLTVFIKRKLATPA